jgi:hypothetical protein
VVPRIVEHLADNARAFANVFVDNSGRHHFQKGGTHVGSQRSGEQRLPRTRRPIQQHSLVASIFNNHHQKSSKALSKGLAEEKSKEREREREKKKERKKNYE